MLCKRGSIYHEFRETDFILIKPNDPMPIGLRLTICKDCGVVKVIESDLEKLFK